MEKKTDLKLVKTQGDKPISNEEVVKRIDSMMGITGTRLSGIEDRVTKLEQKIAGMAKAMHDTHIRSEAFYSAIMDKKILTLEELNAAAQVVHNNLMDAAESLFNMANKLVVVDKAAELNDYLVVAFEVKDVSTGEVLDKNDRVNLTANPDKYKFTQIREVVKASIGHKANEEIITSFAIPADEADNPYAGKSVEVKHTILRVKVVSKDEETGPTGGDAPKE